MYVEEEERAQLLQEQTSQENFYVLLEEYKEPVLNNIKNATYYYNLGVSTADSGDPIKARVYLERAIELDPEFEDPYNYLFILILTGEKKIIEEMNSLSVSKADNLRYDVLKRQRDDLYKDCVPLLEKSIKINKNQFKIKLLMDVYGTLGDTVGYNKMKKMLQIFQKLYILSIFILQIHLNL